MCSRIFRCIIEITIVIYNTIANAQLKFYYGIESFMTHVKI